MAALGDGPHIINSKKIDVKKYFERRDQNMTPVGKLEVVKCLIENGAMVDAQSVKLMECQESSKKSIQRQATVSRIFFSGIVLALYCNGSSLKI